MRVFDDKLRFGAAVFHGSGQRLSGGGESHSLAVGVFRVGVHGHDGAVRLQIDGRRHLQPAAAVVGKLKVRGGHREQVYRPVKAAVEGEIGFLRVNFLIFAVVHADGQQVFARLQMRCQLGAEG